MWASFWLWPPVYRGRGFTVCCHRDVWRVLDQMAGLKFQQQLYTGSCKHAPMHTCASQAAGTQYVTGWHTTFPLLSGALESLLISSENTHFFFSFKCVRVCLPRARWSRVSQEIYYSGEREQQSRSRCRRAGCKRRSSREIYGCQAFTTAQLHVCPRVCARLAGEGLNLNNVQIRAKDCLPSRSTLTRRCIPQPARPRRRGSARWPLH